MMGDTRHLCAFSALLLAACGGGAEPEGTGGTAGTGGGSLRPENGSATGSSTGAPTGSATGSATGTTTAPTNGNGVCSPVAGPFDRQEIHPPGSLTGSGPCGCEEDDLCVRTTVKVDETTYENKEECVTVPEQCSGDASCCCMSACEGSPLECTDSLQDGVVNCKPPIGS